MWWLPSTRLRQARPPPGSPRASACRAATRWRSRPSRRTRRFTNTGRSSALPRNRSRPANGCTSTMWRCTTSPAIIDFAEGARNDEILPVEQRATFEGYVRPNGKTGTRNYIGVLTSVNCSASVAKFIAEAVQQVRFARRLSGNRRRRALRARHRLRHGRLWRGLRSPAPHAMGLRHASQSRRLRSWSASAARCSRSTGSRTNTAWSKAIISRP